MLVVEPVTAAAAAASPAVSWSAGQAFGTVAGAAGKAGTGRIAKLACVMSNVAVLINGNDSLADL